MIDNEYGFTEYDVNDTDSGYKEMRNKRNDEWRDSKRVKQDQRKAQRNLKRNWE
jgi:vacuolar-type H+-ATPase subunit I/STV1